MSEMREPGTAGMFRVDDPKLIGRPENPPAFPIELPHAMEIGGKPAGKTLQRSYLTYAFSVLGLPAISVPCGFTREGLPIGLQIVGRPRQEATVLRAAAAFEVARPWAQCIPPVVTRSR